VVVAHSFTVEGPFGETSQGADLPPFAALGNWFGVFFPNENAPRESLPSQKRLTH
jgi:hypothetical protein